MSRRKKQVKIIDSLNPWVGSWFFLLVHVIWFTFWLIGGWNIELLILIVSLEAIILMILLLMAQNRKSIKDDIREETDLRVDLENVRISKEILKHIERIERKLRK